MSDEWVMVTRVELSCGVVERGGVWEVHADLDGGTFVMLVWDLMYRPGRLEEAKVRKRVLVFCVFGFVVMWGLACSWEDYGYTNLPM
jgi:hypothetical protein